MLDDGEVCNASRVHTLEELLEIGWDAAMRGRARGMLLNALILQNTIDDLEFNDHLDSC